MNRLTFLFSSCFVLCLIGCGDPQLHQVTGKVTLGGKPYQRLLVYMRPIDEQVDKFRMGVGETDAKGVLTLRSSAGDGLASGKYRVSFSCMVPKGNDEMGLNPNEKHDDNPKLITEELVPLPYASDIDSPVEFEIGGSDPNEFVFDIPSE
ncbi:hypothetical protein [Roseiconus lacunae]|uniref:Lipoprotein n=1 Tax=Roseiconus lacunae TaxID=2605694 RepID=A0ABT7PL20_9BACT|nr:hypothetical protein [Roseiconus lacunae]MCD0460826.1 hypothetical protein [Roseiconus lacunae]MDM4017180.1 hypothetical protein [Roseiconus lacunae]